MVIYTIYLFLTLITYIFIYILIKEFNRLSIIKKSEEENHSFFIALFISISLLFWIASDFLIVYFAIVYIMIFSTIISLNRKKIIIPLLIIGFANLFYLLNLFIFKGNQLILTSVFFYLKVLEPIALGFILWLSLISSNKKRINMYSNGIFIIIYSSIELYFYNIEFLLPNKIWIYFIAMFLFMIFFNLSLNYVEKFYKKWEKSESSYQKNNLGYIKPHIKDILLRRSIVESLISFGFVGTLKWNKESLKLEEKYLHRFLVKELEKYYEGIIFFQNDIHSFNFFIPIYSIRGIDLKSIIDSNFLEKRTREDQLYRLSKIIRSLKNIDFKIYVSIYGIDSTNINDLLRQNDFLVNNETMLNYKNNVIVFDSRKYVDYLKSKQDLINTLNKFEVNWQLRIIESNHINYYKIDFEVRDKKTSLLVENYAYNDCLIKRYLVVVIFKKMTKMKIVENHYVIIDLPFEFLHTNFKNTINKISKLYPLNKVIFSIDLEPISLAKRENQLLFKHITSFLLFQVVNFKSSEIKYLIELKPKYFSKSAAQKFLNTRTKYKEEKETIISNWILLD